MVYVGAVGAVCSDADVFVASLARARVRTRQLITVSIRVTVVQRSIITLKELLITFDIERNTSKIIFINLENIRASHCSIDVRKGVKSWVAVTKETAREISAKGICATVMSAIFTLLEDLCCQI